MILVGNQRGGAKNLALHLLKDENERVEVHELRGFCSDNLMGALNESYAVSRATKCKQFLFSLSLNPPKEAAASHEDFENAIARVEEKLGLTGQPRAIVFHEKEGRCHCHAVWSRIKTDEMKAIQLSFTHNKLKEISRELYLEHGWTMPRGLANSKERDPRNFTHQEWQQAKRIGKDARAIKADFQDSWAVSDSKAAFAHALQERGYKLARGDRRGFVAIDYQGEVYPVSRWAGVKTKQVRERLGDLESLPSVAQAKDLIAREMLPKMQEFEKDVAAAEKEQKARAEEERQRLAVWQRGAQTTLDVRLAQRRQEEEQIRQARFRRGLWGLLDRLTGRHRQTTERNERETRAGLLRDREEKAAFIARQTAQKSQMKETQWKERQQYAHDRQELQEDIRNFRQMQNPPEDERKQEFLEKRRASRPQTRIRGPTMGR